MAGDRDIQHQARRNRPVEPHRGELFGACHSAALGQHAAARADFAVEVPAQRRFALLAQTTGALFDYIARNRGIRAAGVPGRGENGNT